MTRALIALAVSFVVLLSACGDADPFVGSWRDASVEGGGPNFVIAKVDDGYRVAIVHFGETGGWMRLERQGDTLKGTWRSVGENGELTGAGWMSFTIDSDRLLMRDSQLGPDAPAFPLVKVSDSTTPPSADD